MNFGMLGFTFESQLQIKMADGEKYEVDDRLSVALGPTSVIVIDADGVAHVLPLLTMTGITYLKKKKLQR